MSRLIPDWFSLFLYVKKICGFLIPYNLYDIIFLENLLNAVTFCLCKRKDQLNSARMNSVRSWIFLRIISKWSNSTRRFFVIQVIQEPFFLLTLQSTQRNFLRSNLCHVYFSFILFHHARATVPRQWDVKISEKCFKYSLCGSWKTSCKLVATYDSEWWWIWKSRTGLGFNIRSSYNKLRLPLVTRPQKLWVISEKTRWCWWKVSDVCDVSDFRDLCQYHAYVDDRLNQHFLWIPNKVSKEL